MAFSILNKTVNSITYSSRGCACSFLIIKEAKVIFEVMYFSGGYSKTDQLRFEVL